MQMSGVMSLIHDMCINGCLAFMGPFAGLEACLTCSEPRYEQVTLANSGGRIKKAHQEFHTMPIGPQLQALWCHPESAAHAKYLDACTHEIIEELKCNNRLLDSYDNFLHGTEFLQAVESGRIKPGDMVVMFLMDGAQLYRNKQSDCWIGIWIIALTSITRKILSCWLSSFPAQTNQKTVTLTFSLPSTISQLFRLKAF